MNISKELYRLNFLNSYPLSDKMLVDWAVCISELEPLITPEILREIINKLITGMYEYKSNIGMQNIFLGFKAWIIESRVTDKENKYLEAYLKYVPVRERGYIQHTL